MFVKYKIVQVKVGFKASSLSFSIIGLSGIYGCVPGTQDNVWFMGTLKKKKANNNTFLMKQFYVLNEITYSQAFTPPGSGVKGTEILIALFF